MMKTRTPWFTPPNVRVELAEDLAAYDIPAALSSFDAPILVTAAGKDRTFPLVLQKSVADLLKGQGANVTYIEYASADHMNTALNSNFVRDAAPFFSSIADTRN